MEKIARGVVANSEFLRFTQEEVIEDLKTKARKYSEIASDRHMMIKKLARESWKKVLKGVTEEQRTQYIQAQRSRIIRFYVKPYPNQGVHPEVRENDEVLVIGFYVDSKDQPTPSVRDIADPLAFFDFDKWEPLRGCEDATEVALKFLDDTRKYDNTLKVDYLLDVEAADLTTEQQAVLSEIENSVDNYLFRRQEEENHL